jgi:hypothetical protein
LFGFLSNHQTPWSATAVSGMSPWNSEAHLKIAPSLCSGQGK